jgi:DNA-binding LacI/PurR family transcriptional regulator
VRRSATLKDVAKAAGVSQMTVSNVVNGRFDVVRPETRARVEGAIRRLSYRPKASARGLRTDRNLTVGMLIVDPTQTFMTDPFIARVLVGVTTSLRSNGYGCLLEVISPGEVGNSIFIRHARIDGLCVFLSGRTADRRRMLDRLIALHEPIIAFQETIKRESGDYCVIRQDDYRGAYEMTVHMIEQGARDFLVLVPSTVWPAVLERKRGVREAARRHASGATITVLECGSADYRDTQSRLASYLDAHDAPDAIFTNNDQIAIAAQHLVQMRGLNVPEDLMITGFNGFEFWQYTKPTLTTAFSPAYEMGIEGGKLMLLRIETGWFDSAEIVFPVKVHLDASTSRQKIRGD